MRALYNSQSPLYNNPNGSYVRSDWFPRPRESVPVLLDLGRDSRIGIVLMDPPIGGVPSPLALARETSTSEESPMIKTGLLKTCRPALEWWAIQAKMAFCERGSLWRARTRLATFRTRAANQLPFEVVGQFRGNALFVDLEILDEDVVWCGHHYVLHVPKIRYPLREGHTHGL